MSTHSTGSNIQENASKVNVVYSGEGNLLSQTIGQRGSTNQPQQQTNTRPSTVEKGRQSVPSQADQKQVVSIADNRLSGGQKSVTAAATSSFPRAPTSVPNQGTSFGSSNTVTQTTQPIPSGQSFGQRIGQRVLDQSNQQSPSSNVRSNGVNQFSSADQTTYNNRVSFGQKLPETSTTAVPYSPSIPPFRSTTTSIYTPTATSYNQHTQTYNGQSRETQSYTQHDNLQRTFSNNQFQVPSKEYLPSADNTRTARTNELSFGNHGSSALKLSSSQNFATSNGGNQQDARQQFTYPVDQVYIWFLAVCLILFHNAIIIFYCYKEFNCSFIGSITNMIFRKEILNQNLNCTLANFSRQNCGPRLFVLQYFLALF